MGEKKFVAPTRNSAGGKGSRKRNETIKGKWLGGTRTSIVLLCYARPVAGKPKSEISGSRRRPKPTPWEKNRWGSQERRKKSREKNGGENTQI